MITFLPVFSLGFEPLATVTLCARALDDRRLGKQRVEAKQILEIITNYDTYQGGWRRHPAVLMWYGYSELLKAYYNAMIVEWCLRGKYNNLPLLPVGVIDVPWWWVWEAVYYSHAAMLQRKDPVWYSWLTVPVEYLMHGYIWPSRLSLDEVTRPLSQIAGAVPEYLLRDIRCPAVLKTGKRKGQVCALLLKDERRKYCGHHTLKME